MAKRAESTYRSGRSRDWLKVKCLRRQEFLITGFTERTGVTGSHRRAARRASTSDPADRCAARVGSARAGTTAPCATCAPASTPWCVDEPPCENAPRGKAAAGVRWVRARAWSPRSSSSTGTAATRCGTPRSRACASTSRPTRSSSKRRPRRRPARPSSPHRPPPRRGQPSPRTAPGRRRAKRPPRVAPSGQRREPPPRLPAAPRRPPARRPPRVAPNRPRAKRPPPASSRRRWSAASPSVILTASSIRTSGSPSSTWRATTRRSPTACCPTSRGARSRWCAAPGAPRRSASSRSTSPHTCPTASSRCRSANPAETAVYPAVESAAGVLALVQMGALELHVWGSHIETLEQPDQMVFDLDPAADLPFGRTIAGGADPAAPARPPRPAQLREDQWRQGPARGRAVAPDAVVGRGQGLLARARRSSWCAPNRSATSPPCRRANVRARCSSTTCATGAAPPSWRPTRRAGAPAPP